VTLASSTPGDPSALGVPRVDVGGPASFLRLVVRIRLTVDPCDVRLGWTRWLDIW